MKNHFTIQNGVLLSCTDPSPVIIVPDGVREIGKGAFPPTPVEVLLPEGLEVLQGSAFYRCENLRRISLPAGLRVIGDMAFGQCHNLEEVQFAPGPILLEPYAFGGCLKLERIVLPEGLTDIPQGLFLNCPALKEAVLPSTLRTLGEEAFGGCFALKNPVVPPGVRSLPVALFHNVSLESLTALGVDSGAANLTTTFCRSIRRLTVPRLAPKEMTPACRKAALLGFADWERRGGKTDPSIRARYVTYLRNRRKSLLDEAVQNLPLLNLMVRESVLTREQTDLLLQKGLKAQQAEAAALLLDYMHRSFGEPDPAAASQRMLRSLNREGITVAEFNTLWEARRKKDGTLLLKKYLGEDTDVLVPAFRGVRLVPLQVSGLAKPKG